MEADQEADRQDLERRLSAATPSDTVRGIVFNAVFDVAREGAGDEAARRCDPARKGSRVDFFSYPVAEFLRITWNVADVLARDLPFDETLRRIGLKAGGGVLGSPLGKTLATIAGMDPRRLMAQTPAGYRATVSYGERIVEWVSERHVRHTFRRDFLVPSFHCGVFVGALQAIGARGARAEGRQTGFLEAVYDVTWQ
jgi:uncharacterized protein (TIGR02265 family)